MYGDAPISTHRTAYGELGIILRSLKLIEQNGLLETIFKLNENSYFCHFECACWMLTVQQIIS